MCFLSIWGGGNGAGTLLQVEHSTKKWPLCTSFHPYYEFYLFPVSKKDNSLLYWDKQVITDETINFNKSNVIILDKTQRKTYLTEVGVPSTGNIRNIYNTKITRYHTLKKEVKRIWKQDQAILSRF